MKFSKIRFTIDDIILTALMAGTIGFIAGAFMVAFIGDKIL